MGQNSDVKRLIEKSLRRVNNIEVNKFAARKKKMKSPDNGTWKNENSNENGGKQKSPLIIFPLD